PTRRTRHSAKQYDCAGQRVDDGAGRLEIGVETAQHRERDRAQHVRRLGRLLGAACTLAPKHAGVIAAAAQRNHLGIVGDDGAKPANVIDLSLQRPSIIWLMRLCYTTRTIGLLIGAPTKLNTW